MRLIVGLLLVAYVVGAGAEVYKCKDSRGQVTYTNERPSTKGCTTLSADLPVSSIGGRSEGAGADSDSRHVTREDFPRVSVEQQKARDGGRREILEKELADEQQALDEAQKRLASVSSAKAPGDSARNGAQLTVDLHQRNVDAIRREISNLR